MKLDQLPDVVTGSVVLAALYLLIGLSWVIVFRASQMLNFGTGEILVVGPFLVTTFAASGLGYGLSIGLTVAIMAVVGFLYYRQLLRPFAGFPVLTPVIVTMGMAIVVTGAMQIFFGVGTREIEAPFENAAHRLPGGITLTTMDGVLVLAAALFYGGMLVFIRRTRLGVQMRAANEDVLLASQTGLNVYWIFGVVFAISFVALTVAGIGTSQRTLVSLSAIPLGLQGLVPAMVGGLDSVGGVLAGSLIVAVAGGLTTLYLGGNYTDLVVFVILLVVLAFKPSGLFGSQEVRRV